MGDRFQALHRQPPTRAYRDNLFEFLRHDRAYLARDVEQFKSYEFHDAVVAGRAMIAAADGSISASQRNATARFIRDTEALRVFEMSEVMTRFDWFTDVYGFNITEGEKVVTDALEQMRANRLARACWCGLCCAIAASDGDFDRTKMDAVRQVLRTLELDPSEFRL